MTMANVILNSQTFKIGEYLFRTGDPPLCAYLIQSGTVDVVINKDGEDMVMASLEAGQLVGEMALIDNQARSAAARAQTATTCVLLSKEEFKKRIEEADPLTRAILRMLVDRLRRATALQQAEASTTP
jgi:CRP-like cAMP-binding protein